MKSEPLSLHSCIGLAIVVAGALLGLKGWIAGGVRLTDFLLLVPFFFCFVPVLSRTFGEGLYLWDKHRGRFELYDAEEHPIQARIFYLFFIAATLTFASFLFMKIKI